MQQKNRIYKAATEVVNSFQYAPAFLLSLFKALPKFQDSIYAQQKLLCVVDELEELVDEETAQDDEDKEYVDDEDIDSIRSRIHLSTFKYIEATLSNHDEITNEDVGLICQHVHSIMYSHLISHSSQHSAVGVHPTDASRIMKRNAPLILKLAEVYVGQESRAGSMLAYDINRVFDGVFAWAAEHGEEDDESSSDRATPKPSNEAGN
jgi:hypothetical protein